MPRFITFISLLSVFVYFGCIQQSSGKPDPDSNNDKRMPDSKDIDASFIKIGLSVYPFSKDSIEAVTKFTNTSDKDFILYEKYLPGDKLYEEVFFVIRKADLENLVFKKDRVTDNMERSNLEREVHIKAGQSLFFKTNLADNFQFPADSTIEYGVAYSVIMPMIKNGHQVFENDVAGGKKRPVLYFLASDRVEFSLK